MYGQVPQNPGLAPPRPNERDVFTTQSGGMHSYSHEELRAFASYINGLPALKSDPELAGLLPLSGTDHEQFFNAFEDGVLICKLINAVKPGTIDAKHITPRPKLVYHKTQNLNTAMAACHEIGLRLVNVGAEDIQKKSRHIVLGLVWQVVSFGLLSHVNLHEHPELVMVMEENVDAHNILSNSPEQGILRWMNYHLKNAQSPRTVSNFSKDISDGQVYLTIMNQIAPDVVPIQAVHEQDPSRRAQIVVDFAQRMGIHPFVTPQDILNGNKNLNLAFCADMFNKYPGIRVVNFDEAQQRAIRESEEKLRQKLEQEEEARRQRWAWEDDQRRQQWAEEDRQRHAQISAEQAAMDTKRAQWQSEAQQRDAERQRWEDEQRRRAADDAARRAAQERDDAARRASLEREAYERKMRDEEDLRRKEEEMRRLEQQTRQMHLETQRQQIMATNQPPQLPPQQMPPPQMPPQQMPPPQFASPYPQGNPYMTHVVQQPPPPMAYQTVQQFPPPAVVQTHYAPPPPMMATQTTYYQPPPMVQTTVYQPPPPPVTTRTTTTTTVVRSPAAPVYSAPTVYRVGYNTYKRKKYKKWKH